MSVIIIYIPYSHVYRPHSCIGRTPNFEHIFFRKQVNLMFSQKGKKYGEVENNVLFQSDYLLWLSLFKICS